MKRHNVGIRFDKEDHVFCVGALDCSGPIVAANVAVEDGEPLSVLVSRIGDAIARMQGECDFLNNTPAFPTEDPKAILTSWGVQWVLVDPDGDFHWSIRLRQLGACLPAVEWCYSYPDLHSAWNECHHPGWMLWLQERCGAYREQIGDTLLRELGPYWNEPDNLPKQAIDDAWAERLRYYCPAPPAVPIASVLTMEGWVRNCLGRVGVRAEDGD